MARLTLMLIFFLQCFFCYAKTPQNRSNFDNILLIINFNHPFYDNIPFLKEIYSPYFKNIVFYGEEDHPEVRKISHHHGWFVHRAIADAMKRWPNYRGYICCQDDCLMNCWNFKRLNKDKIWFHQYSTASLINSDSTDWPWWFCRYGYESSVQAYPKLDDEARKMLNANCGPVSFAYAWADFVYIPSKYKKRFIKLSKCFDDPNVFIEIAIPTLLLCLEKFDSMEHLNAFWGGTINSVDLQKYSSEYDWIHPIKFSVQQNRETVRNIFLNHAP